MITRRTRTVPTVQLALTLALTLALGGLLLAGCKKKPKDADTKKKAAPAETMAAKPMAAKKVKERAAAMDAKSAAMAGATAMAPAGAMAATPTTAPPTTAPATGPVSVQLALGLNVAKLRKTFVWKKVMAMDGVKKVLADDTYAKLKKALGKDPIEIVDAAHIVLAGKSLASIKKPEHIAILVKGRFDAPKVLRKLLTIPVKPGKDKPKLSKVGGKDALVGVSNKKKADFAIIAVSKDTLAISSMSLAAKMATGDLTGGDAAIKKQLSGVKQNALLWGVFGAVKMPSGRAAIPALAALSKIVGGSFQIDVKATRWSMANRLDMGAPQAAKALIQFVTMMKMAFSKAGNRPGAPPKAVMSILGKMQIKANGQVVHADLALTEAEVKGLIGMLLKKM